MPSGAKVTVGPNNREQESAFTNATLQTAVPTSEAKPAVAISVATFVVVPDDVTELGVQAVADYLSLVLGLAADDVLSFEVQVGEDVDWWNTEDHL